MMRQDEFAPLRAARAKKLRRLGILGLLLLCLLAAPAFASGDVRIEDTITDETAQKVETAVALAKKNHEPGLRVVINSPGGEIFAGLRIIRALSDSGLQVTCEVEDMAASMAAVILESPGCTYRIVRASSVLMFHEALTGFGGYVREGNAEAMRSSLSALNRVIAALVAPRLGLSVEEYLARVMGGREVWIAGIDAVQARAADEVR